MTDLEEDDRSVPFLEALIKESSLSINNTEEKINLLSNQYDLLMKYFGDSSKDVSFSTFWEILHNFSNDMKVRL